MGGDVATLPRLRQRLLRFRVKNARGNDFPMHFPILHPGQDWGILRSKKLPYLGHFVYIFIRHWIANEMGFPLI